MLPATAVRGRGRCIRGRSSSSWLAAWASGAYSLCVSFHFVGGSQTIFGTYFLVPIGLAVSVVWLEIAIAARRRGVMIAASTVPFALVYLAGTGHRYDAVYMNFLDTFRATAGRVAAVSDAGRIGIVLRLRGGPTSPAGLGADVGGPGRPRECQSSIARLPRHGAHPTATDRSCRAHARLGRRSRPPLVPRGNRSRAARGRRYAHLRTPRPPLPTAAEIGVHLAILGTLAVGAVFRRLARRMARWCGALALVTLGVASALQYLGVGSSLPASFSVWYPLLIAASSYVYGYLLLDRRYVGVAIVILTAWAAYSGSLCYQQTPANCDRAGPDLLGDAVSSDRNRNQPDKSRNVATFAATVAHATASRAESVAMAGWRSTPRAAGREPLEM